MKDEREKLNAIERGGGTAVMAWRKASNRGYGGPVECGFCCARSREEGKKRRRDRGNVT